MNHRKRDESTIAIARWFARSAVASATEHATGDLLLQLLALLGWRVQIHDAADGVAAVAVQVDGGKRLHVTASAETREALPLALFEQVCAQMYAERASAA